MHHIFICELLLRELHILSTKFDCISVAQEQRNTVIIACIYLPRLPNKTKQHYTITYRTHHIHFTTHLEQLHIYGPHTTHTNLSPIYRAQNTQIKSRQSPLTAFCAQINQSLGAFSVFQRRALQTTVFLSPNNDDTSLRHHRPLPAPSPPSTGYFTVYIQNFALPLSLFLVKQQQTTICIGRHIYKFSIIYDVTHM